MRRSLVWLRLAAVLVVAGVFLAAAWPKILDPVGFAESIDNYRAFPSWSIAWLATTVPMLELVGALALLWPRTRKAAALVLASLTVGFLLLIAQVIARGIDLNCGCFGQASGSKVDWALLWRDLALLGLIVVAGTAVQPSRRRDP